MGKSTVLSRIKAIKAINGYPVIVLDEPIEEWNTVLDTNNVTLFELFYKNPFAHAFTFQMLALVTRANLLKQAVKAHPDAYIFTERCLATDRVFAQLLFETNCISREQYAVYDKAWKVLNDVPVAGVVYLRADASLALERCISRGRRGETLSLEYLNRCGQLHEIWLQGVPKYLVVDSKETTAEAVKSILGFVKPKETQFMFEFAVLLWAGCCVVVGCLLCFA